MMNIKVTNAIPVWNSSIFFALEPELAPVRLCAVEALEFKVEVVFTSILLNDADDGEEDDDEEE